MRSLETHLSQYAAYHLDRRNIATHLVGIPLIVVSIQTLLARPSLGVVDVLGAAVSLSPALVVTVLAVLAYLRLSLSLGLLMGLLLAAGLWLAQTAAAHTTQAWLIWGIGGFFVGWVFQFVGHYFEGRKPAFVDDLAGLFVGPLFVVVEVLFALGLYPRLHDQVRATAGALR